MIIIDLVPLICDYLIDKNYYFINKSIYKMVQINEKNDYWKRQYDSFFEKMNKEYLILKGDYNWKSEYIRIKKFENWNKIDQKKELFLGSNKIKEIPKELGNLPFLELLFLCDNQIREIPKELVNLGNLRELYLVGNQIKEIPKELCDLVYLQYLHLDFNKIKHIPNEIKNLKNLRYLCLSNNEIKNIQTELSFFLNNLKYLNLCNQI